MIDIGVNLTNKSFARDRDAVVTRAVDAGVATMVITGTSVDASRAAAELAAQLSAAGPASLYATAGVHPHHASSCDTATIDALRELAALPRVVAIGECGLDFNRNYSPRPAQLEWFEAQLELAASLGMPLFLHERDAADTMIDILRRHRDRIGAAVIHCFTGDARALRSYLDLDLHIGITGWICDERRGRHLHDLVAEIPLHRLMLETDAPYLLPRTMMSSQRSKSARDHRDRRNEPAFLTHVLDTVARCTGRSPAEVARATTATATAFFGLGSSN